MALTLEGIFLAVLVAPFVAAFLYVATTLLALPLTGESIFRFTDRVLVDAILALIPMKPGQRFYDLGCGDGRMLVAANHMYGVHGVGYEVNLFAYLCACFRVWRLRRSLDIRLGNFMHADLSDADVVYCYQASGAIQQLRNKLERELRPGTIVISNTYTIERWLTPKIVTLNSGVHTWNIYIYTVPSKQPVTCQARGTLPSQTAPLSRETGGTLHHTGGPVIQRRSCVSRGMNHEGKKEGRGNRQQ